MSDLRSGTLVDGYRVTRTMAWGGHSGIYRAEAVESGDVCVLKVMHSSFVDKPSARGQFELELRAATEIGGAHVLHALDSGEYEGRPWMAVEYLDGETLDGRVRRGGTLELVELSEILRQLCVGIGDVHRAGLVHGDIHPDHVFLARGKGEPGLRVVLLGFGLMGSSLGEDPAPATIGTIYWMAPEQVTREVSVGPYTDIWPLGLLAYWMLTEEIYWTSADPEHESASHAFLQTLMNEPIEPPTKRLAKLRKPIRLPRSFDWWFARCVARSPDDRFASAEDAWAAAKELFV